MGPILYVRLRVRVRVGALIYPSFYQLDDLDKFVQLISNMQKEVIDFLGCALSLRRSCLYST